MKHIESSPFGGQTRTRVLVRQALAGLERDGLVAGRLVGKTRQVRIDPGYFAREELETYLARLSEAEPDLRAAVSRLRRRPRATGKPARGSPRAPRSRRSPSRSARRSPCTGFGPS